MSEYFPKLKSLGPNVKVEPHFSNYAIKTDLEKIKRSWLIGFSKKTDLANLKSDVDKLDIDKVKTYQLI